MIKRIWHGWTTPENADRYERLLQEEVFVGIAAKEMPGYRGIELLRHEGEDEVEFVTIMTFDSLDSVRDFVGDDIETAYVPPAARQVLAHFDARSRHYEVRPIDWPDADNEVRPIDWPDADNEVRPVGWGLVPGIGIAVGHT